MIGDSITVPLFATPFTTVDTGASADFNARLARSCEARRAAAGLDAAASRDPLHHRGAEDFLDSSGAELGQLMLGRASIVIAGLGTDAAGFGKLLVQARGWYSIVLRGGHVPVQHFPDASWLAVYCLQAGEPDAGARNAGVLRLHERRLGSIYRDAGSAALAAPWRFGNHTWSPRPGWLALFPAYVPHEVSVVRADLPLILVFAKIRFVDPDPPRGGLVESPWTSHPHSPCPSATPGSRPASG